MGETPDKNSRANPKETITMLTPSPSIRLALRALCLTPLAIGCTAEPLNPDEASEASDTLTKTPPAGISDAGSVATTAPAPARTLPRPIPPLPNANLCFANHEYPRNIQTVDFSFPFTVNNLGQLMTNKTKVTLPALPFTLDFLQVVTMNDLGQWVGYTIADDDIFGIESRGFVTRGYDPRLINNLGQSAGMGGDGSEGFLRETDGRLTSLGSLRPVGLNNLGQVVGVHLSDDPTTQAGVIDSVLRDSDGRLTTLPNINGEFHPHATGINDVGQIVGYYQDAQRRERGFVMDAQGAVTLIEYPFSAGTTPRGINNLGQVVGTINNINSYTHFVHNAGGQWNLFQVGGPNTNSWGNAINDLGQETGGIEDVSNATHTFKSFLAGPYFVEPMSSLSTSLVDIVPSNGGMTVWGSFTPCPGHMDPQTDPMLIKLYQPGVAWASLAIPGGSFQPQTGKYEFHGALHGMPVDAYIWGPLSDGHYDFRVYASGVPGLPKTNPVTVFVAVGGNVGSTTVTNATVH